MPAAAERKRLLMCENTGRQFQSQQTFVLLSTFNKRRFLALWAEKVEEKQYPHLKNTIQLQALSQGIKLWMDS